MQAKKSLGQHFLTSPAALAKIIAAADITRNDTVLEIGPGKGVLTEALLAQAKKVVAIEKDARLIPYLKEKFKTEIERGVLELLEEDILDFDPASLPLYKLVANIPYYITRAILQT